MFLGPGVLVSRGRLALSPPFFAYASLPRLAFAQSATPFRTCYKRLRLQFAVGANLSTDHGRFLRSLHFRQRLPSQTCTRLPIVSTVIGSPLLSPFRSPPVARLQLQSTHSAGILLPLCPTMQLLHGRTPRLCSVVVLHCLGGGCQRPGFMSNACNAATVLVAPAPQLFFFDCRLLWVS